jgi:hypothetical protein
VPQAWNSYTYAGGDPSNNIDPSGQSYVCADPGYSNASGSSSPDCYWQYSAGDSDGPPAPDIPGCLASDSDPTPDTACYSPVSAPGPPSPPVWLTQLESLQQEGVIAGWTYTPTGVDLSLVEGDVGLAVPVCIAQPELCLVVGAGLTIYAAYTYGPALIEALQNAYQTSRASKWSLTCYFHLIGTPGHAAEAV